MKNYRKFLEPKYGEVAPQVVVAEAEDIDLVNPRKWRNKYTPKSASSILSAIEKCKCYNSIMEIETSDAYITKDNERIPIRVYSPEGTGKFPVMVFYHGGGFMYNDFSVYDYVMRYISRNANAVVVGVEYRLAPEYKCPVGREDAYDALVWAADNMEYLHGDITKMCVCGDSAGGNLAASVALMARDRKGPHIEKQILVYPVTCFTFEEEPYSETRYGTGYFLEYRSKEGPLNAYFENEQQMLDKYNAPLLAENLEKLPKACFMSAECDPLLDQGLMYAARLEDAGVAVEYNIYEGMIHGFLNATYEKTFKCLDDICCQISSI